MPTVILVHCFLINCPLLSVVPLVLSEILELLTLGVYFKHCTYYCDGIFNRICKPALQHSEGKDYNLSVLLDLRGAPLLWRWHWDMWHNAPRSRGDMATDCITPEECARCGLLCSRPGPLPDLVWRVGHCLAVSSDNLRNSTQHHLTLCNHCK